MTLDELVLEWSYRTQRGYPKLDDPSDVLVLKQILKELDLPFNEVIRKLPEGLSPEDLRTQASFGPFTGQTRAEILIRKIESDEPLELQDGGEITVANKEEVIDALNGTITKSIPLTGINGEKSSTNKLKKTIELGTSKAAAGTTDEKDPVVDTDTKEELVIVMYNVLKENGNLTDFNDNKDYANNFKIINNSTIKYQDVGDIAKGKIEELFNLIGGLENPLTKVKHVLNNPYSIAKEILKFYPNSRFERGEVFDMIRMKASQITTLPADKWNPGDIYIVNSEPNISDIDDGTIVPWNELFVNNWGDTDAPLVSVSLKEEKHQLGRAKSYLNKFVDNKGDFNIAKKDLLALTTEELQTGIATFRSQVRQSIENEGLNIEYVGNGWDGFPEDEKRLRAKYGCYKLLNFLLIETNPASILGLFAYGLSIDRDEKANPTFFKLVGGNKGTLKKKVKYPAGVNTELDKDTPVTIEDRTSNGNIKISGTIIKTDSSNFYEKEDTFKVLRSSGAGQIQIV